MARRKLPRESRLRRAAPSRQPKKLIIVFCEGRNTEPEYLNAFAREHHSAVLEVKVVGVGADPKRVVEDALAEQKKLLKQAKRSRVEPGDSFSVWCVFDVDDHRRLDAALVQAHARGIKVGLSNPCFELWLYLHIGNQDGHIEGADLQRQLRDQLPGYDHVAGARVDYQSIKDGHDAAVGRARSLLRRRKEEGRPNGNPSTDVFLLLNEIAA